METKEDIQLLIDEEFTPIILEDECMELKPVMKSFVSAYVANQHIPTEVWLSEELEKNLPEKSNEEIQEMTADIIKGININKEYKKSLESAIANGRSKESWFASEFKKSTSSMSNQQAAQYLKNLDLAVANANEALYRTITTQNGGINQNPSLDGFIAEQYHAQTFNLEAEAKGSQYRAEVLEPVGTGYGKNSVDIQIKDTITGKVVKRYQSKYCKNAEATAEAFKKGNYRGQQKIVPAEQMDDISKKCTNKLEAPDGTTSKPLTKADAQELRDAAQGNKWKELDWNEYQLKDLAMGVAKESSKAALQSACISTGFDFAQKLWDGEEIEEQEVIEKALVTGADTGVKAAVSGALKVGVEKEIITVIPKGTPAGVIANIACVGVEVAKDLSKIASGELTVKEGIDKVEETVISTTAGLTAMGEGTTIGAALGSVLGPIGTALGGFVGGSVGYMAGSAVGKGIAKVAKGIRSVATKVISTVGSVVSSTASAVVSGIGSVCRGIGSAISSLFSWF